MRVDPNERVWEPPIQCDMVEHPSPHHLSPLRASPLRVAVVGAGPAGFYATEVLLKAHDDVSVDLLDRLPTPYGLVRYGVAPDHQKIKSITRLYERTCRDPRVRFLGNVEFGRDLRLEDLKRHYHAVILSVGASTDRALDIPGEDLPGSLSATEFVAWYNGHPDYADLRPPLDAGRVAVIGMGNVAVDVTRILAKSAAELARTDIADHALEELQRSRVREIVMLGRRGPAQGKFTTKELRELGELANADIEVETEEVELDERSAAEIAGNPYLRKNVEVLQGFARQARQGKPRTVALRFFVSPVEIQGEERVERIVLERNRLRMTESGYLSAEGTGETLTLEVGLVLRSVGYRGVPLPGLPFDERRGVIPNDGGRVLDRAGGSPRPGEYVAGWIKRGPSGVIGTNKADATETVESLLADDLPRIDADAARPEAVTALLASRGVSFVSFRDWLALDRLELQRGEREGRPRVKIARLEEMLAVAAEGVEETA